MESGGTEPTAMEAEELLRRLREAEGVELLRLVREHSGELTPNGARQALANPFAGIEVIEEIAANRRLLSAYQVRRGLALHRTSPQPLALRYVPGLYWRDLLELAADTRVRPPIRRSAERYLIERLPSMAVGEKTTIARRASHAVAAHLRNDPSRQVFRALLENPRLTEGVLLPLVRKEDALPQILEMVAASPRWGVRYPIRAALCLNPRTPVAASLRLLPYLRKKDLRAVAAGVRVPAAVRRRAQVLLGDAR